MTTENVHSEDLKYKRARFNTRLPGDRLYTRAHFWIGPHGEEGVWRVGFTKFATRMLGEMVEHGFEVKAGDAVTCGQIIGWMEGFKATTDLFAVIDGEFVEGNPRFDDNLDLLRKDPYDAGWIYAARGTPEAEQLDVHGYAALLDETIDQILRGEA